MGHQRYLAHFAAEFTQRNRISDKQRELLEMIGAGMQDKVIAERLEIFRVSRASADETIF